VLTRKLVEQCNAPAFERRAQSGFGDKSIIAKFHGRYALGKLKRKGIGMMEIGVARGMRQRPIGFMAARIFDHRRESNSPFPVDSQARHLIHFQRGLQFVARPARLHLNAGRALSRLQYASRFGSCRTDMPPIVLRAQS
jgi:hypothetical protein